MCSRAINVHAPYLRAARIGVERHRVHLPPARREVDGAAIDHQHLRRGLGPASSELSDPKRGVELASVPLRRVEWTGCDLKENAAL